MSGSVRQLLSAAGYYDAVTNQALAAGELLRGWGLGGDVFAGSLEPQLNGRVRSAADLSRGLRDDDLLVIHYSAHDRALDAARELPQRKLLVYHNITPPEYLWNYEPVLAARCAVGRERLGEFARHVDAAVTATEFNAQDLREAGFGEVRVVPNLYLFDRARLQPRAQLEPELARPAPTVVFVGRFSPNKRQDSVIKAFALYQRHRRPDARLVLAGGPASSPYRRFLERVAAASGAGQVFLTGPRPQDELNSIYAGSSVLLCLSEHEGFCIPVLEAFHFGLPVIALRAGGVPEVAGDAAVLLDEPDLPTVAELIDLCVEEAQLRDELRRRGEARLAEYAPQRTVEALRETFEWARG